MRAGADARLVADPVGPTLFRSTIPMFFGMLSMIMFNLVDMIWVGRLGAVQLAAIAFTLPIVMIFGSISQGIGQGASAVISRAIGAGHTERVKRLTTDSLLLALVMVALIVPVGLLTIRPVFSALGASATEMPYIVAYMSIWYFGIMFLIVPMVGNNALRAAGDMKTPGIIMMVGAGVNMVIDPILIFGLGPIPHMGIAGAATATVISRGMTMLAALYFLRYREDMITFAVPRLKAVWRSWKDILSIGLPVAGARLMLPLAQGMLFPLVALWGFAAVAAFGVSLRLGWTVLSVMFALNTVMGPFVGQNRGARRYDRIYSGIAKAARFSILFGFGMAIVLALSGRYIGMLFSTNEAVVGFIALYLLIVPIGFGFQGIRGMSNMVLNVLKHPLIASGMIAFHFLGVLVPLAYLFGHWFGVVGVFAAIPIANLISGSLSWILLRGILKKDEKQMAGEPEGYYF